jgi:hypothetical protein
MDPIRSGLPEDRLDVGETGLAGVTAPPDSKPIGGATVAPFESTLGLSDQQSRLSPDDKLERRCKQCTRLFRPRRGSGGSEQLFCSEDCRKISNRERQRTLRRPAYAAPATAPAISQPKPNKTLPREPSVAKLSPWETGTVDIAACDRTEFVLALKDGETAGTRIETWPPEVRALIDQHIARWVEENKDRLIVRAITMAGPKSDGIQYCVVILHHIRKASHPAPYCAPLSTAMAKGPGNV